MAWEPLQCPGRRDKVQGSGYGNRAQPELKEDTSGFQNKNGSDLVTGWRRMKVGRAAAGVAEKARTPSGARRDLGSDSSSVPTCAGTLSKSPSSCVTCPCCVELLKVWRTTIEVT